MIPIELRGGLINKVTLDPGTGLVTKTFQQGNGIEVLPRTRLLAESRSLRTMLVAPDLRGLTRQSITMTFVDGEKQLDEEVKEYSEHRKNSVFNIAGQTLASIHDRVCTSVNGYSAGHQHRVQSLLNKTGNALKDNGINTEHLAMFLTDSYNEREIERRGLVWTHGDYWLNNVIGTPNNGSFSVNGVIDWELAKLDTPYEDFAVVEMSIEDLHQGSSTPFWIGYGETPDAGLKRHYAIVKTMDWMTQDQNFDTDFYQTKFDVIKRTLS